MGTQSRNTQIVHKVEALALSMLNRASGDKVAVDVQLDIFDKISRWIAIKNKLENDDGGGIADYKRALFGEDKDNKPKKPASRRSWSRKDPATGGARLDAIKSRLPAADAGGDDGDSIFAGGETVVTTDGGRSFHLGTNDSGEP